MAGFLGGGWKGCFLGKKALEGFLTSPSESSSKRISTGCFRFGFEISFGFPISDYFKTGVALLD
jgi:hypothetical protein